MILCVFLLLLCSTLAIPNRHGVFPSTNPFVVKDSRTYSQASSFKTTQNQFGKFLGNQNDGFISTPRETLSSTFAENDFAAENDGPDIRFSPGIVTLENDAMEESFNNNVGLQSSINKNGSVFKTKDSSNTNYSESASSPCAYLQKLIGLLENKSQNLTKNNLISSLKDVIKFKFRKDALLDKSKLPNPFILQLLPKVTELMENKSQALTVNHLIPLFNDVFQDFQKNASSSALYKKLISLLPLISSHKNELISLLKEASSDKSGILYDNSLPLRLIQKLILFLEDESQELTVKNLIFLFRNVLEDFRKRTSEYQPTQVSNTTTEFAEIKPEQLSHDDFISWLKNFVLAYQLNYQHLSENATRIPHEKSFTSPPLQKLTELLDSKSQNLTVNEDVSKDLKQDTSFDHSQDGFRKVSLLNSKGKHLTKNKLISWLNNVFDYFQKEASSHKSHNKSLLEDKDGIPYEKSQERSVKNLISLFKDVLGDFQKSNSEYQPTQVSNTTTEFAETKPEQLSHDDDFISWLKKFVLAYQSKYQHLSENAPTILHERSFDFPLLQKLIELLDNKSQNSIVNKNVSKDLKKDTSFDHSHDVFTKVSLFKSKGKHLTKNELTSWLKNVFDHFQKEASSHKSNYKSLLEDKDGVPYEKSLPLLLLQRFILFLKDDTRDLTVENIISLLKQVLDDFQQRALFYQSDLQPPQVNNTTLPYKVYFPTLPTEAMQNVTSLTKEDDSVTYKPFLFGELQKLTEFLDSKPEDLTRDNLESLLKDFRDDVSSYKSNRLPLPLHKRFPSLLQKLTEDLQSKSDNLSVNNLKNDKSLELYQRLLSALKGNRICFFLKDILSSSGPKENSFSSMKQSDFHDQNQDSHSLKSFLQNILLQKSNLPLVDSSETETEPLTCILMKCKRSKPHNKIRKINKDHAASSDNLIKGLAGYINGNGQLNSRYPDKATLYTSDRGVSRSYKNEDDTIERRIIGGEVALPGEFPYQVALYTANIFQCGSCLISHYYVLSAAHCLEGLNAEDLWFRAGSNSLLRGGDIYRVASMAIHEQYTNGDYDIGLIRSSSPVRFSIHVYPMPLPQMSDPELLPGTRVTVSGWGAIENSDRRPSYRLHKLELRTTSRERCRERIMASTRIITERQICASAPQQDAGTCFGDSGGPLVANGKLIGLISWGSPCAIGDPDVYTNIREFLSWIATQMNKFESSLTETTNENSIYLDDHYRYDELFHFTR